MAEGTLPAKSAGTALRPLRAGLTNRATAAEALARMQEEKSSFLVVVDAENGAFLGVVLRGGLENGCESNGHDPRECPLGQHLLREVDVRYSGNRRGDASTEHERSPSPRLARARRRLPIIVLSESEKPIGYLPRDLAA